MAILVFDSNKIDSNESKHTKMKANICKEMCKFFERASRDKNLVSFQEISSIKHLLAHI
jgi:hypothetical protein